MALNALRSVLAELLTRENDGGSKKSGLDSDNMLDDSHKLALVQLMRDTRAFTVKDCPESDQVTLNGRMLHVSNKYHEAHVTSKI